MTGHGLPAVASPEEQAVSRWSEGRHVAEPLHQTARRRVVGGLRFGLPLLILVVEALLVSRGGPVPMQVREPAEQPLSLPAVQVCTSVVTHRLRRDLEQMARGRSGSDGEQQSTLADSGQFAPQVGKRISLARQRVMQSAATDFFARFDRDSDREVRAYTLRVAGACANS